jgi:hypothetical protein
MDLASIHPLTLFVSGLLVGLVMDEFFHFLIHLVRGER